MADDQTTLQINPQTSVTPDKDISIDLSDIDFSSNTEETKDTSTAPILMDLPNEMPEKSDDRLSTPKTEATIIVDDTPVVSAETSHAAASEQQVSVSEQQVTATNSPVPVADNVPETEQFDISKMALDADQKIIEELQKQPQINHNDGKLSTAQTTNETVPAVTQFEANIPVVETPITQTAPAAPQTNTSPAGSTMDLDAVISGIGQTTSPTIQPPIQQYVPIKEPIPTQQPMQQPVQQPMPNMYNPMMQQTPPIYQSYQVPQEHHHASFGRRFMVSILIFIMLGIVGFLLKTMYPAEVDSMLLNIQVKLFPTDAQKATLAQMKLDEQARQQALLNSGMENTGVNQIVMSDQTGSVETGTHSSADTAFDPFADLSQALTGEVNPNQEMIDKLNSNIQQGQEFLDLGKTTNDKVMIKYGGYIVKKATSLRDSIETGSEIDNQSIDKYLAQFSDYLSKLKALVNEQPVSTTSEQPSVQEVSPADITEITNNIENGQTDNQQELEKAQLLLSGENNKESSNNESGQVQQ